MDEQDRPDLLVSETVEDLRKVFLVDHAFPTEWEPDARKKKKQSALRSIGSWIRRSLGISPPPDEEGQRNDDSACGSEYQHR